MEQQVSIIVESLKTIWSQFLMFLPKLGGALLVLVAGWLVAKFLRRLTVRGLRLLRVDVAAEKSGVDDFLIQGGVRYNIVTILSTLVYWFIMFAVVLASLNVMGVASASLLFNKILLFIPNVIVAIIVIIFGSLFARLIQGIVYSYLNNVGIEGAGVLGGIAYYAILIFVVSLALEQVAIGGRLLVSAFEIAFGALCLAMALAFGLGGREWAANILSNMSRTKKQHGKG